MILGGKGAGYHAFTMSASSDSNDEAGGEGGEGGLATSSSTRVGKARRRNA